LTFCASRCTFSISRAALSPHKAARHASTPPPPRHPTERQVLKGIQLDCTLPDNVQDVFSVRNVSTPGSQQGMNLDPGQGKRRMAYSQTSEKYAMNQGQFIPPSSPPGECI